MLHYLGFESTKNVKATRVGLRNGPDWKNYNLL
jgi:hypothetical protein